jgi:hypothetical protein
VEVALVGARHGEMRAWKAFREGCRFPVNIETALESGGYFHRPEKPDQDVPAP